MTEPDMFLCAEDRETLAKIRARLAEAPDPLDESDHRPRHDADGEHWEWRQADLWCTASCSCSTGAWRLGEFADEWGPLTFCDCPC